MNLGTLVRSTLCAAIGAAIWVGAAGASAATVVVPRGQPVEIAFASDLTGFGSSLAPSLANAVRMAIGFRPTIHGFPIRLNTYDAACGDAAADVAAANAIVAHDRNAGVIGQLCSFGFDQALPVYEAGGIVTISGSATAASLGTLGFSVFDRVAVADPEFNAWYATVGALPGDLAWQNGYEVIFGAPPVQFADLYFDATSLLIADLRRVSRVAADGSLVINRDALATAVRATRSFPGVTCTVRLDRATGNRLNDPESLSRCAGQTDDEGDAPTSR